MKRTTKFLIATLFTALLPLAAAAEMPGVKHGEHGQMMEGMVMLGEQTVEGVKAMAHLQDVTAAMAKMGMKKTHHFMVAFVDMATGKQITSGAVALKIKSPSGQEGEAVRMMAMEGHFGADIILAEKGVYTFTLGTKVGGEKKRQFEFKHEIK